MATFLVELVAVFLGVYLSFRAADFQERRADRKTVRRALAGIKSDLAAELPAVEWLIKVYGPTSEAGEKLYHDWQRLPDISARAEEVFYALHFGAPYSPARAHYETAKSTGTLGMVENEELRSSIASVFEQQQRYIKGISDLSVDWDFDFFRKLRPYVEYGDSNENMDSYIVPGENALPGSVNLLSGAADELRSDRITRNSLYMMVVFGRLLAQLLETYAEEVRSLDAKLEQFLSESPHFTTP